MWLIKRSQSYVVMVQVGSTAPEVNSFVTSLIRLGQSFLCDVTPAGLIGRHPEDGHENGMGWREKMR